MQKRLEHYPELDDLFRKFLSVTIQQLTRENSIAKHFKTIQYPSTRYEELVDGKWVQREFKEFRTQIAVRKELVEDMDLISIRKEIYDACSKTGADLDKEFVQAFQNAGTSIDTNSADFFDVFLATIKELQKEGGNPMLIVSPETARWLQKEMLKPEILKKIRIHLAETANDGQL